MFKTFKIQLLLLLPALIFTITACTPESEIVHEEDQLTMDRVMRIWEEELKSMRTQLSDAGTTKIHVKSALLKAEDGIPSDSSILDEDFYRQSYAFYKSYSELFTKFSDISSYNAVIDGCVSCHEQHCPGPLRSIKNLYIDKK